MKIWMCRFEFTYLDLVVVSFYGVLGSRSFGIDIGYIKAFRLAYRFIDCDEWCILMLPIILFTVYVKNYLIELDTTELRKNKVHT